MNCFLRWLGTLFHCANRLYCVSQLSVDLSMWFAGSEKVTCSDEFEEAAILLALSRFDCVRWAIGSMFDGGLGAATTLGGVAIFLGSVASTLGAVTQVMLTLGSGVGLGVRFGLVEVLVGYYLVLY
jgi:hypothetical protein